MSESSPLAAASSSSEANASASASAQSNTTRNPPPQLFQAPPPNAPSSASPGSSAPTSSNPTAPPSQQQQQQQQQQHRPTLVHTHTARDRIPTLHRPTTQAEDATNTAAGRAEDNRVDALWAKMQLTLEEVELSALGSTHVFGKAHSTALEDLREAQIALAKAWGRGDTDDEFAAMDAAWEDEGGEASAGTNEAEGLDPAGVEGGSAGAKRSAEEGGEIVEARRRREANERFFKKVENGVADVVGKLNEVAAAMAKVEKESREIWDERDSGESSSVAS